MAECLTFPEPIPGYQEKVFFHSLAADANGETFIALVNKNAVDGKPLGIVARWNQKELPYLTQWKMPCKGFYVCGLEPGTIQPIGRGVLRERGLLPMIEGQGTYTVTIDFEVLDDPRAIEDVEKQARGMLAV